MRGLEGAEGLEAGQGLLCLDEASDLYLGSSVTVPA